MPSANYIFKQVWNRRYPFLAVFSVVIFISYGVLFAIDFIPEPVTEDATEESTGNESATNSNSFETVSHVEVDSEDERFVETVIADTVAVPSAEALPTTIIFDSLNRTVPVMNPTSRAIADLDKALLSGAVRHPDSANFQDIGNIFILGHSSYLPNVLNRNFQAFNGIQNLKWGDTIRLQSAGREYVYRVDQVYEAKASEVIVPNSRGEAKLTLATCDSFGSQDDRFMVEATLVESYEI